MQAPRVTVGIATYNRERYVADAIRSVLAQTHRDLEVLVVDDGSSDRTADVAEGLGDPRVRVVRHGVNRGAAAAHNTLMREMRGELLAWLDDDDLGEPDWLERAVGVFDRHPATGVVYGAAATIDERGAVVGEWPAPELSRLALLRLLVRRGNAIAAPGTVTHRRVCEQVGDQDASIPKAHDYDFWLRALAVTGFRRCPGGPVVRLRRHGGNSSDASQRTAELRDVETAIRGALRRHSLRELVPELDWAVLPTAWAERRARLALAADLDARGLASLAAELRAEADRDGAPDAPTPRVAGRRPGRVVLTSFGFNDSGGGTVLPRHVAKELAARGWQVTVFHAGVGRVDGPPYAVRRWSEDGVDLVGVFNRPHGLLDLGHPEREIDDPPIAAAFAQTLDEVRPDVVHFHNLHNLGASLLDEAFARGVRTVFTPHNYWLLCPRNYLFRDDLSLCDGPGDGSGCAPCVGSRDPSGYVRRRTELRERFAARVDVCLAPSEAVRQTLIGGGFPGEGIVTVPQALPQTGAIWRDLGRERRPGRRGGPLVVGFFGSAYPHKGPQDLVAAAQLARAEIEVQLHGDVAPAFAERLEARDRRGVVRLLGPFDHAQLPELLAGIDVAVVPSMTWDCAPLVIDECRAGRVPVVVARMGGLAETVRDGVDGLVYEGRSPAALAAQLDRLADEPGLLERLQAGVEEPRRFADYVDELERHYAGEAPVSAEPAQQRRPPLAVRWVGDQVRTSSLAGVNRAVCAALDTDGETVVAREATDGVVASPPLPRPADVEVRHGWPPDFEAPVAGRLALIQPWEFGSLPAAWQQPLQTVVDEVWVPSAFVRRAYLDAGLEADRVHVVPNGVDLDRFRPGPPRGDAGLRLLFVGGTIHRKGIDVLVSAFAEAFAGRDDVTLVVKDMGGASFYHGMTAGDQLRALAAAPGGPRVEYVTDDLSPDAVADLVRSCDVLVHPYRGEGFAMPVLEAMACGLPVVVTAGGPTDEFCPDEACWRIASERRPVAASRLGMPTLATPWMLEPSAADLVRILRLVAADPAERRRRGAAARRAAQHYSWEAVGEQYAARLRALAARPPRPRAADAEPFVLPDARGRNVLATPAWRGEDRLPELLRAWADVYEPDADAALYLVADPAADGEPRAWEERVLAAAETAGVALDAVADISILDHAPSGDDLRRLLGAVDAFVPLHAGCGGLERLARTVGTAVVAPAAAALRPAAGADERRAA